MVTAYDSPSARLAETAGMDGILVGDSAAMTVLGHDSTVQITVDEMLVLTRAVSRSVCRPLVVADMPFGSFQVSDEEAVRHAVRLIKEGGAGAVKLEGAGPTLTRVEAIVGVGIPVMGHVGLTPQSAVALGGYRVQGRRVRDAQRLLDEAHRAAGRRMLRRRARSHAGDRRRAHHRGARSSDHRHRRRSLTATARSSSGTICWASRRPRAAIRQALRRPRHVGQGRARGLRDGRALGKFPEPQHTYDMAEGEAEIFEGRDLKRNRLRLEASVVSKIFERALEEIC